MSAPVEIVFIVLLLLEIVSFHCPVFDAAPANSAALTRDRCIPDCIMEVKGLGTDAAKNYFVNKMCNQLLHSKYTQLDFHLNCSNLSNTVFIPLAAPQVPLVLLEAGCISTGPFDCSLQANVPMTITGIVLLRNQESPILLVRKTDYHVMYLGRKNSCVAVWCGAEKSTCFDSTMLHRRKTRSRNALRKRQSEKLNKAVIRVDKKAFTNGAILVIVLLAVVFLFGLSYVASLCIARMRRRDDAHVSLLESTKDELHSQETLVPTAQAYGGTNERVGTQARDNRRKRPESPRKTNKTSLTTRAAQSFANHNTKTIETQTDHEMMQPRTQVMTSLPKNVCESSTQTDDNCKKPDLLEKTNGGTGAAGAEKTTDKIEYDTEMLTLLPKNVCDSSTQTSDDSKKPNLLEKTSGRAGAEETTDKTECDTTMADEHSVTMQSADCTITNDVNSIKHAEVVDGLVEEPIQELLVHRHSDSSILTSPDNISLSTQQMRELQQLLEEDVDQWFVLGVYLDLPVVVLREIQANFEMKGLGSWKRCLIEVLGAWMNHNTDPKVSDILKALLSVDRLVTAERVSRHFSVPLPSKTMKQVTAIEDNQTCQKYTLQAVLSRQSKSLCDLECRAEEVEKTKKVCEESLQIVKEELEDIRHKTHEMTMKKAQLETTLKRKERHHTFVSAKNERRRKVDIYVELQEDILTSIEEHKSDLVAVNRSFFQLQNERAELENKIKNKEKELEDLKSEIENLRQQNAKLLTVVSNQQLSFLHLTTGISLFQQAQQHVTTDDVEQQHHELKQKIDELQANLGMFVTCLQKKNELSDQQRKEIISLKAELSKLRQLKSETNLRLLEQTESTSDQHILLHRQTEDDCISAFHEADRETALDLLLLLRDPERVRTYTQCESIHDGMINNVTLLHLACRNGWLEAVEILLDNKAVDPSIISDDGLTALHFASFAGHHRVVECLLNHNVAVNCQSAERKTALHYAAQYGQEEVIETLLSCPDINPQIADTMGNTPVDYALGHSKQILTPYGKCKHNIDSYIKVFVLGSAFKGKLLSLLKRCWKGTALQGTDTFGVVPAINVHKEQIIFYSSPGELDSADIYNSPLELASPAVFTIVLRLGDNEQKLRRNLHFWMECIKNIVHALPFQCGVIIITDYGQTAHLQKRYQLVKQVAENELKNNKNLLLVKVMHMQLDKDDFKELNSVVSEISSFRKKTPACCLKLTYYCSMLYEYIQSRREDFCACLLQYLIDQLNKDCTFFPTTTQIVCNYLMQLSNLGLIVFLKNEEEVEKSWVFLNISMLLSNINDLLLSKIEGLSPIVHKDDIKNCLHRFDMDGMIQLLTYFQVCKPLSKLLVYTQSSQHGEIRGLPDTHLSDYYHFPSVAQRKAKHYSTSSMFRHDITSVWMIECSEHLSWFSGQFLDVLFFYIEYGFDYGPRTVVGTDRKPKEFCVWKNSIKWISNDHIETKVDLSSNQFVSVTISCSECQRLELVEQRTALVTLIKSVKEIVCPQLGVSESIMYRGATRTTDFASVAAIKRAILEGKKKINTKDRNSVLIRDFLIFESLEGATRKVINQLYNEECSNDTVSEDFLKSLAQTFASDFNVNLSAKALDLPIDVAAEIASRGVSQKEKVYQLLLEWKSKKPSTYCSLKERLLRFSIMPAKLN